MHGNGGAMTKCRAINGSILSSLILFSMQCVSLCPSVGVEDMHGLRVPPINFLEGCCARSCYLLL